MTTSRACFTFARMRQLTLQGGRSRRRHRRCYRWTPEEKARYLEAFRRSDESVAAFCEATDLSPITFTQWQREARRTAGKPGRAEGTTGAAFARVELIPAAPQPIDVTATRSTAIRLVVRGVAGHEAALDGVDAATAIQIVAVVLKLKPRR